MAKFKIQKSATVNQYFDATNVVGGVGGLTSIGGSQIQPQVRTNGSATSGSILRSKGRGKFLVTDGSNSKVCTLVNYLGAELTSGQMSIVMNKAVLLSANLTATVNNSTPTTFAYLTYATANVAGVVSPTAGLGTTEQVITGTGVSGNVVVNTITTNNGLANANVSFSSQNVSNVTATNMFVSSYTARLTNKFATDFQGNKYLWTFSNPTSTTVKLPGA